MLSLEAELLTLGCIQVLSSRAACLCCLLIVSSCFSQKKQNKDREVIFETETTIMSLLANALFAPDR